jgi:hypothetical protein
MWYRVILCKSGVSNWPHFQIKMCFQYLTKPINISASPFLQDSSCLYLARATRAPFVHMEPGTHCLTGVLVPVWDKDWAGPQCLGRGSVIGHDDSWWPGIPGWTLPPRPSCILHLLDCVSCLDGCLTQIKEAYALETEAGVFNVQCCVEMNHCLIHWEINSL